MRTIAFTLLALILLSCSKNESTPSTTAIIGNWHMARYIEWQVINGFIVKDTATLGPLDILADFKADSTVFVQELYGTRYNTDNQRYVIEGNTLYLTKYWNPTVIDTFQITTFNATTLSLHLKSNSANGLPEKWHYWVR